MEDGEARSTEFRYNEPKMEQGIRAASATYIKRYIHVLPSGRRLKIMVNDESEVARLIHHEG